MRRDPLSHQSPITVSVSGVDGAGKSTQIEILCNRLRQVGLRVQLLTFWEDVALLTRFRQFASVRLFNSETGVGAPHRPVNRRDKNVQSWYMTPVRLLLYSLDAMALRVVKTQVTVADVVVFDRYLYDELVNLPQNNPLAQLCVRGLLKVIPHPDVACLLDADPMQARERKPEYPLEFLQASRASYLRLSKVAGLKVIPPGSVTEVSESMLGKICETVPALCGTFYQYVKLKLSRNVV